MYKENKNSSCPPEKEKKEKEKQHEMPSLFPSRRKWAVNDHLVRRIYIRKQP